MDEVKLALEMNKLVHDECKDVPHDIGLRLLEIVKRNMDEQFRQCNISNSVCMCEKPKHNYPEMVWCDNCGLKIPGLSKQT